MNKEAERIARAEDLAARWRLQVDSCRIEALQPEHSEEDDPRRKIYAKDRNPLSIEDLPAPVAFEESKRATDNFKAIADQTSFAVCAICSEKREVSEVKLCCHEFERWGPKLPENQAFSTEARQEVLIGECAVNLYSAGVCGGMACVCSRCAMFLNGKRGMHTPLGLRYDLGKVPDSLPPLSTAEKMAIQLQRTYGRVLVVDIAGVTTKRIHGHMVTFSTKQAPNLELTLPREDIGEVLELQVAFPEDALGSWKQFLVQTKLYREHLLVRVDVIAQWLLFLKANHPEYRGIRIDEGRLVALSNFADHLIDAAVVAHNGGEEQNQRSNIAKPVARDEDDDGADRIEETFGETNIPRPEDFSNSRFVRNILGAAKITVSDVRQPTNEYTDMQSILSTSFPWLFPYGLPQFERQLSEDDCQHFLHHDSGRFAKDSDFVFYLFNFTQRLGRARCIATSASTALSSRRCAKSFTDSKTRTLKERASSARSFTLRKSQKTRFA